MKTPENTDVRLFGLPPLPSQSSEAMSTLLWSREVLQAHQNRVYAVQSPDGIEELKSVNIGGVEQWLHIRGRNRNNPVLLFLHGGPGASMIGTVDGYQRGWEDYFTVVQWDQRQTGKSYYPADDENNPLTVEQFVSDTEEVIQYLRSYLEKDKLLLIGISWGTVLGMYMASRHPEWLHGYVGIGQVVTIMENERTMWGRTLAHAKAENKEELVAQLEAIAPYPDPDNPVQSFLDNHLFVRKTLSGFAGEVMMHHMFWNDTSNMLKFSKLISPHLSLTDLSNTVLGNEDALTRSPSFTQEFMSIDLPQQAGSAFDIPIFFFTGAHDWQTPVPLSDQWFNDITAPHKKLIHFEDSAHGPMMEEPGKFLVALVNTVLPVIDEEQK